MTPYDEAYFWFRAEARDGGIVFSSDCGDPLNYIWNTEEQARVALARLQKALDDLSSQEYNTN